MRKRHPFIVIYGAPNLGKTHQAQRLAKALNAHYVKYPVYDQEPTGPIINKALRESLPISPLELQTLCAQNRRDFETTLKEMLSTNIVVAEAYKMTGIIAGLQEKIDIQVLEELNANLLDEDLAIFLDGERFSEATEANHRFEAANWDETRVLHQKFAKKYDWTFVNANQSHEKVHTDIQKVVEVLLSEFPLQQ